MDIENIKRHFAEISNTLVQKNHDYGNAFEELWKLKGIGYGADKIFEKALRIETLSREENQVKGESLKDALMDVIGYAALCLDKLDCKYLYRGVELRTPKFKKGDKVKIIDSETEDRGYIGRCGTIYCKGYNMYGDIYYNVTIDNDQCKPAFYEDQLELTK